MGKCKVSRKSQSAAMDVIDSMDAKEVVPVVKAAEAKPSRKPIEKAQKAATTSSADASDRQSLAIHKAVDATGVSTKGLVLEDGKSLLYVNRDGRRVALLNSRECLILTTSVPKIKDADIKKAFKRHGEKRKDWSTISYNKVGGLKKVLEAVIPII